MKKNIIIKALFATLALTVVTSSIGFVNNSATAVASVKKTSYPDGTGGVWNRQVMSYLASYGYTNVVIYNIDQYGNRYCTSSNHSGYYTVVYVGAGGIVGHEDIPDGINGN